MAASRVSECATCGAITILDPEEPTCWVCRAQVESQRRWCDFFHRRLVEPTPPKWRREARQLLGVDDDDG